MLSKPDERTECATLYLKTLEIQGFKSFAEKINLSFHAGLTAVVGPNGSGKSNIADAVRWVLGEQSAKTLRGGKMEDVIFAGTQHRKALGFAAVSITFDNADGALPIGYAEVTVTRRIYRSGESEYLLNKTACRLKDIHELFMNTGVGREGYSIIGQGRIDEILSTRSEERRAVFEEAAGITKYKVRKREAERKLEATRQNLERIQDIIAELDSQLDPLGRQAETAKSFLALSEELKSIEVAFFLETVEKTRERMEEIRTHQAEIRERMEAESRELDQIKIRNEQRTERLETLRSAREAADQGVRRVDGEVEKASHQIQLDEEKIRHLEQANQNFGEDLAGMKTRFDAMDADIEKKRKRIAALERDGIRFAEDLAEAETRLAEVLSRLSEGERETEEAKQRIMDRQDSLSEARTRINNLRNDMENTEDRKRKLQAELLQLGRERDRAGMTREELDAGLRKTRLAITAAKERVSGMEQERAAKKARLDALRARREDLAREHSAKTSRHHVLQDLEQSMEGYSHSVKTLLQACRERPELGRGIHGALAQLVRVDPEFETAVEVCLGGALQNIVAETDQDAKRAIDHLKKQHLGRATFLPINAVKGRGVEDSTLRIARGMDGYLGTADEHVQTDPKYREIVKNLLGRTLVAENMDAGIAMARRFEFGLRIVTREGELFNAGGSMTGGSQPARNASLLGRQRLMGELETEMKSLAAELEKLESARKNDETASSRLEAELDVLRKELSDLELVRLRDESQLAQLSDMVKKLQARQELLRVEESELTASAGALSREAGAGNAQVAAIDAEITTLRESVMARVVQNRDEQLKRDEIHADVNDYRVSVLSVKESLEAMHEQLLALEEERMAVTGTMERRAEERARNGTRMQDARQEIAGLRTRLERLGEERTGAQLRLQAADEDVRITEEEYAGLLDAITAHNQEILSLQEESGRLEARGVKFESDMETISTRLWDEYGLTLATAEPFRHPVENPRAAQARVNDLKAQIRALGPVNVSAIEDFTKTKERHAFMVTQRDDLVQGEEKLGRVIHEITLVMRRQFLEQFELINKNFSIVFRELFEGGAAEVQISDMDNVLESGIDIIVQPPGKKLQNMMLLSGGERAMVAISLIFAILRMRPAPFYLLDEIEASLDDANVFKFADYIRRYTDSIQFLCITHRKGTMEAADILYGVTMQEHGVSKVVSMRLEQQGEIA